MSLKLLHGRLKNHTDFKPRTHALWPASLTVFGPATARMNAHIKEFRGTIPATTRQLQDMHSPAL